jgi:uncharacterized membrane protein
MMDFLASLAQPWADLYGGSSLLQGLFTFLHIGGVVVAGGLALASDRSTFRVSARPLEIRREHLAELGAVHGPVLGALGVVLVSGAALLFADVETFLPSWLFWFKMSLFAVLMVNGLLLRRAERGLSSNAEDAAAWKRLRWAAGRSVALWGVVLLVGVLLPLEA